jgi:hypothetical protein
MTAKHSALLPAATNVKVGSADSYGCQQTVALLPDTITLRRRSTWSRRKVLGSRR